MEAMRFLRHCVSPSGVHVSHIVCVGTRVQMVRTYAGCVVTRVQHVQMIIELAVEFRSNGPMSLHDFACYIDRAVAARIRATAPKHATFAAAGKPDRGEKPFAIYTLEPLHFAPSYGLLMLLLSLELQSSKPPYFFDCPQTQ